MTRKLDKINFKILLLIKKVKKIGFDKKKIFTTFDKSFIKIVNSDDLKV